jgi:F-type H+-transporting ATPase subunit epsilon
MAEALKVHLVTPRGAVLTQRASSLTVCSELGEMGILPGHCAIIAAIVPGLVSVTLENGQLRRFFVDRGFLEAGHEEVSVLTERCLEVAQLDVAVFRARVDEIEKQLAELSLESPERDDLCHEFDYYRAGLALLEPRS